MNIYDLLKDCPSDFYQGASVLYHDNCVDGAMSAALIDYLYPNWLFYPMNYDDQVDYDLFKGRTVFMVDFSLKRDQIYKLARIARRIVIIDHHQTAEKNLSAPFPAEDVDETPLCPVNVVFDMNHCGAVLVWKFFHKDKEIPPLLEQVEARDLWKSKEEYPHRDYYSYALMVRLDNFRSMREYLHVPSALLDDGEAIHRFVDRTVVKLLRDRNKRRTWMRFDDVKVPCINTHKPFSTAAADYLCQGQPFAAAYWIEGEAVCVFLTSDKESDASLDVSLVAETLGGGGHRHAAGFSFPLAELPRYVFERETPDAGND